ncbi:MAG: hypothetical protein ACOC0R_06630 [Mariniphaga sp.]
MREWVSKLKETKAVKWHTEHLKNGEYSNFTVYANVIFAFVFGHIMTWTELAILFFLMYAVDFTIFVSREKKDELEEPPWEKSRQTKIVDLNNE